MIVLMVIAGLLLLVGLTGVAAGGTGVLRSVLVRRGCLGLIIAGGIVALLWGWMARDVGQQSVMGASGSPVRASMVQQGGSDSEMAPSLAQANIAMPDRPALQGVQYTFTQEQAQQVCQGFGDVALNTLIGGAGGQPYKRYEDQAKQLSDRAAALPFMRSVGAQQAQVVTLFFSTRIENQYYILPEARDQQLKWANIAGREKLVEMMTKICEMKIGQIH